MAADNVQRHISLEKFAFQFPLGGKNARPEHKTVQEIAGLGRSRSVQGSHLPKSASLRCSREVRPAHRRGCLGACSGRKPGRRPGPGSASWSHRQGGKRCREDTGTQDGPPRSQHPLTSPPHVHCCWSERSRLGGGHQVTILRDSQAHRLLPNRPQLSVSLSVGLRQASLRVYGLQRLLGAQSLECFRIKNTSNHPEARMAGVGRAPGRG